MLVAQFKKLSFTQQLIWPIALAGCTVLGGIGFLSAEESFRETKQKAIATSMEMGLRYAEQVKIYLDKPFAQAEVLGRTMEAQIRRNTQDRKRSHFDLQEILLADSNYLATWSAWEPNAFDGNDAKYANLELHEQSGRFYPWWIRQGDKVIYKTLLNPETPDLGDWYFKPIENRTSMLMEPYSDTIDGKKVVMTSAIFTILREGKAQGLVGVDLSLNAVMKLISEVKPYPSSNSYLISDTGMVVAAPKESEVMQPLKTHAEIEAMIAKGESGSTEIDTDLGRELYLVIPVSIYNLPQKWTLLIHTPMKTILASAYESLWKQVIFSVLGLILLLSTVYWGARMSSRKISEVSQNLNSSSEAISSSIEELNHTGMELAESSAKAASSIDETAASLEQMTSLLKNSTQSAEQAALLSGESANLAQDGERKVLHLISTMTEIEKSSQKIEEITQIIDDIAFQTNLLALNASVEAARAGEHGKGFAVVAEAVRSLAQRSASAAKDINLLINTSVDQIKKGTLSAQESGETLRGISRSIEKVAAFNQEISKASQEQTTGVEVISSSMRQLDSMVQNNANQAGEIVENAKKISVESAVLTSTVHVLRGNG